MAKLRKHQDSVSIDRRRHAKTESEEQHPSSGRRSSEVFRPKAGKSAASPQQEYKVGDVVFFSTSNYAVTGEAMFLVRLNVSPEDLVLVCGKADVRDAGGILYVARARASSRGEELAGPFISGSIRRRWRSTADGHYRLRIAERVCTETFPRDGCSLLGLNVTSREQLGR